MNSENEKILNQSIQFLKSIGPKRAESFKKIGISTIRDLLFYFPSRHLDRTTTITTAKAYSYLLDGFNGEITIIGKVIEKEQIRFGKKELLKIQMRDSSGFFECVWFQGIKYFSNLFKENDIVAVSGKPVISKFNALQFTHPDFDRITEDESINFLNTGKIIPFYKVPKELKMTNLGDFSLRKIINTTVENYSNFLEETLPDYILTENKISGIVEAVRNYHFPDNHEKLLAAVRRFKFEELFYLEILVALKKYNYKTKMSGISMKVQSNLIKDFLNILPFKLTGSQLKSLSDIRSDMEKSLPMNRLLQGDVGSGKTIVAFIAMLIAIDNGFQAVLMVPTEILADQHAKNITSLLDRLYEVHPEKKIKLSLLLGGQKKSSKEKILNDIKSKESDIIIGTHALFEENVEFFNLGLVIVDEQHRFGVDQRWKLQSKGKSPDIIVMSATPIPRTLSMTIYGDLDVSIINELPKNRIPIKTILRGDKSLPDIYKFIIDKLKEGYQSFVVYPLVEESEKLELKAVQTFYNDLTSSYLKNLSVGLIHGRMSWQEKEETMLKFKSKQYDILMATTVIEVGIDIPDANIILINDAQRFGLSQLHQLRGRVGRGSKQAYCILVTKDEFTRINNKYTLDLDYLSPTLLDRYRAAIRLQSMVNYNDGFKIAEIDMKLRGPGNIFGIQQSGFPELHHADLLKDEEILFKAKEYAFAIVESDPKFIQDRNQIIKKNLFRNYSSGLKYAQIA